MGEKSGQASKRKTQGRDLSGVTRMRVESTLVSVQMRSGMGVRLSASVKETGHLIYLFTKAVATKVSVGVLKCRPCDAALVD